MFHRSSSIRLIINACIDEYILDKVKHILIDGASEFFQNFIYIFCNEHNDNEMMIICDL